MGLTQEEKKKILENEGFGTLDMLAMKMAIGKNKTLDGLMDEIEADPSVPKEAQAKIIVAFANKWKTNPNIYSQMEADLKKTPELANRIQVTANGNPASLITAIKEYEPGNMGANLPVKGSYLEAERKYASSASASTPPMAVVAGATQPSAPAPTQTASRPSSSANDDDAILDAVANFSDDDIKKGTSVEAVHMFADRIAKMAVTVHGTSPATANGFAAKIKADPNLSQAIATNLQQNPAFVRQLARMAKDKTPLTEPAKSMARREMENLMANPERLADAKYVRELQQKIQMAEQYKNEGIGGMLQSMFGQLRGGSSDLGSAFAGFTGPHTVFTMAQGGGLFPTLMINQDSIRKNEAIGYARSTVGANDLKTFPEPYKTAMVKGADGKQVAKEVPNTFKMNINGKETDVILARGLMANEVKGHIDPATNQFVPSNKVAFWGTRSVGGQPELLYASKDEFLKYKSAVDAASAKYGDGKQLAFTDYTEQDARVALRNQPQIQIASVDPQTGAVTQKQVVAGLPVTQGQVRPKNTTAPGQDMDYELQG
jgi:hypothetical protein